MIITIVPNCIWYSLEVCKKIQSLAKTISNYHSFCIDTLTRAWIIALGIKSRPAKYRRNRAGKDLFYHINSIVNRGQPDVTNALPSTPFHAINKNNLLTIKIKDNSWQSTCANHAEIHIALINCRSVVNKSQDIQLELVNNNNLDLYVLTEIWLKEDDTITSTRLCPDGYKSLSIPRHDKVGEGIAIIHKGKVNISKSHGSTIQNNGIHSLLCQHW